MSVFGMLGTKSKMTLVSLTKHFQTDLMRSCSRFQSEYIQNENVNSPTKVRRSQNLKNGNNCVLITSVFDRNVRRCLQNFENKFNIPVRGATYFERNTGLGYKPCLLLRLAAPIPWHRRVMRFEDLMSTPRKTGSPGVRISYDTVKKKQLTPIMLYNCEHLSDQIHCLYHNTVVSPKVQDFHSFIVAMLDDCLKNVKPELFKGTLHAFGSSPCGLALQESSDLDVTYITEEHLERDQQKRFLRQAGFCFGQIETLSRVQYILRASVPIIRFRERLTSLGVDVSISMGEGVRFADLFVDLREFDDRIFPLIVAVRFWSRINNLTSIHFSNFVQTSLLIFFLQQVNVIPPLKYFITDDKQLLQEDLNEQLFRKTQRETLGDLMTEFFEFYLNFDFKDNDLNLYDGTCDRQTNKRIPKETMFMENPFHPDCANRNICKNVTKQTLKEFKLLCKLSLTQLESDVRDTKSQQPWGLSNILPCERPSALGKIDWNDIQ